MDIYQCPDCELRFRFPSELDSHIADDHPQFRLEPRSIEDALIGASHRHHRSGSYAPNNDKNAG